MTFKLIIIIYIIIVNREIPKDILLDLILLYNLLPPKVYKIDYENNN
jgi:hypothetical protein